MNTREGRFPDGMRPLHQPHNLTFNPENGEHTLLVSSPLPGHWFMLAYVQSQQRRYYDYNQEVGNEKKTENPHSCDLRKSCAKIRRK